MRKIFYFLLLLLLVPSVLGETLPNNVNTTESVYNSQSVSLNYSLDISDSLSYLKFNFKLKKNNYPYTIVTTFKDSKNNVLKVQDTFTYFYGLPFDTVSNVVTVSYNEKIINYDVGSSSVFREAIKNYTILNPFESENSFNLFYKTSSKSVIHYGDNYILNNDFFINQINLSSIPAYTDIKIEYLDNGIAIAKSDLNQAFNSYNPVFKIIFLFAKGTLWTFNVLGIVSDNAYYNYQVEFIGEGSLLFYLNFIISFILTMIKWIATMGLLWVISICSMIIFLYSYIQAKNNMLLCFKLFIHYEKSFFMTVFIKPLMYVYDKFLMFWK